MEIQNEPRSKLTTGIIGNGIPDRKLCIFYGSYPMLMPNILLAPK